MFMMSDLIEREDQDGTEPIVDRLDFPKRLTRQVHSLDLVFDLEDHRGIVGTVDDEGRFGRRKGGDEIVTEADSSGRMRSV